MYAGSGAVPARGRGRGGAGARAAAKATHRYVKTTLLHCLRADPSLLGMFSMCVHSGTTPVLLMTCGNVTFARAREYDLCVLCCVVLCCVVYCVLMWCVLLCMYAAIVLCVVWQCSKRPPRRRCRSKRGPRTSSWHRSRCYHKVNKHISIYTYTHIFLVQDYL
jgi:hypothetical protein